MAPTQSTMTAEFMYYNRWANLVLIDACSGLGDEQLASGLPGSFGTIYDTLVHIIRSEAVYYRRLTKVRLEPPFAWDSHPLLAAMRPYAEEVGSALVAAAEQVDPARRGRKSGRGRSCATGPPRSSSRRSIMASSTGPISPPS